MSKDSDQKTLERLAQRLKVPEGFTASWAADEYDMTSYVLTHEKDGVWLIFRAGGRGTTKFKVGDKTFTFDRRGVEDSFYWKSLIPGSRINIKILIAGELERVAKRREFHKTAIKVPMIDYTVSPDKLEQLKKQLAKQGQISFHPSGFGTGYTIVKQKPKHNYGVRRASSELEAFFGIIVPLWVVSFDAD